MYIFIYRCFFSLRECKKWPVILFAGTRIRDWVWGPTISARSTCTLSFLWPGVRHYQDVPMASLAWRPRWSLCAKRRGDHVEKPRKNISKMCPTVQSVPILRKTNNIRKYLLIFATISVSRPDSILFIAFFLNQSLLWKLLKPLKFLLTFVHSIFILLLGKCV